MRKKTILLFAVLTVLFTACSSNHEETDADSIRENKLEALEFEKLCSALDAIGSEYESPTTRINWNKWGGRIFSATVDGITGYIAGPAGWAVGPLCSWAFDEQWERCTNQMRAPALHEVDPDVSSTYVFNDGPMTQNDSIGYYHNLILDKLANSGKTYKTMSGEIDYQGILDDCLSAAQKYGIDIHISSTDKQKYLDFSKDIVCSFADCCKQEITIDDAYYNMSISYANKFGTKPNLDKVEIIQSKIVEALNCIDDESSVKEYADQVNIILRDTNVSPELKSDLKTVTDITVNSKLYWTTSK